MPSDSILVAVFHNSVVKGVRSEIPCTDRMAGFSCARATKHKSWCAANVTVASATALQGSHKSLAYSGNVPIAVNRGRNLNVSIAAVAVIEVLTANDSRGLEAEFCSNNRSSVKRIIQTTRNY